MKMMLCLLQTLVIYATVNAYRYYFIPEDQDVSECPSQPCATLNHYRFNPTLFMTSNTEFYFLPGNHQFNINVVITLVHNVSLIGISSSPAVMHCFGGMSITITDSDNIIVSNLVFKKCGGYYTTPDIFYLSSDCFRGSRYYTNLLVDTCSHVTITNISFWNHTGYGLVGVSITGMLHLDNIFLSVTPKIHFDINRCSKGILLCMEDEDDVSYRTNYSKMLISNLVFSANSNYVNLSDEIGDLCVLTTTMGLEILLKNPPFDVYVSINKSSFTGIHISKHSLLKVQIYTNKFSTNVFINSCYLSSSRKIVSIHQPEEPVIKIDIPYHHATVVFHKVTFDRNEIMGSLLAVSVTDDKRNDCIFVSNVSFVDLTFVLNHNYFNTKLTKLVVCHGIKRQSACLINVLISGYFNVKRNAVDELIVLNHTTLHIQGKVLLSYNVVEIIVFLYSSIMKVYNNITFLSNECAEVIMLTSLFPYIVIFENTTIVFKSNKCYKQLITINILENIHTLCLFQYFIKDKLVAKTMLDNGLLLNIQESYNFVFTDNIQEEVSNRSKSTINYFTSHCQWLDGAAFNGYDPGVINRNILNIQDSVKQGLLLGHTGVCYCPRNGTLNCSVDLLGQVYPGQTLQIDMCAPYLTETDISVMLVDTHNIKVQNSTCKLALQNELTIAVTRKYKTVKLTIVSNATDYCSLFFTAQPDLYKYYEIFHVQILPCPIGFTLQNGICECDPLLVSSSLRIITCYINEMAIERPASSWITYSFNTSKYQISSHCPSDYCSPQISKQNLAQPDSQCQFHRTGLLCSQCQAGLSMVIGSSRCMKCTSTYLLLTIVILVVGILLVLSLYCLHLTVTKGAINGMIFYANAISINDSVFLTNSYAHQAMKTFISFANLDLGIETCFYNGMDSYAKMWLQLFFPFYLIMMATLLIVTSRYSTRIQRLTFTRSLPVLATLFLLSYTGILRNVSTVLFSYSAITELPSNHQHLVWSIDASVPLFGVKFTILFITCLILFLVLIPFNMILLFTRYMMRFRIISRFKPMVDAFQGSYKDRHYYWMAVHILLRNLFFALYVLPTEIRLMISTMLLTILIALFAYTCPNKNTLVNVQELLLLINVTIIYAVSYQCSSTISSAVTNVMIGIAFIHFTIIMLYHFLTFTCHCDIENKLWTVKEKVTSLCYQLRLSHHRSCVNHSLEIPERTYDYAEYREGLVSDDFIRQR